MKFQRYDVCLRVGQNCAMWIYYVFKLRRIFLKALLSCNSKNRHAKTWQRGEPIHKPQLLYHTHAYIVLGLELNMMDKSTDISMYF